MHAIVLHTLPRVRAPLLPIHLVRLNISNKIYNRSRMEGKFYRFSWKGECGRFSYGTQFSIFQTELSSVGRALDCSGCSQQSKGRWFDSGSSDFFNFSLFFPSLLLLTFSSCLISFTTHQSRNFNTIGGDTWLSLSCLFWISLCFRSFSSKLFKRMQEGTSDDYDCIGGEGWYTVVLSLFLVIVATCFK